MSLRRIRTNPDEKIYKIVGILIILGMIINIIGFCTMNMTLLNSGFIISTGGSFLQICWLDRTRRYIDIETSDVE